MRVLEGEHRRRLREHDERRALNHQLAQLVAVAFHAPRKMPDFRPLDQARAAEPSAADYERVRGHLIGLALRSQAKKGGGR